MKCPNCGSNRLLITGTAVVDLKVDFVGPDDDDFEVVEDEICSNEWFDESPCSCRQCQWTGRVAEAKS